MRLVAQGQSNRQIADTLGLAEGSVKSALDRIRRDLGAENRWHACAIARHLGLLDQEVRPC